MFQLSFNQRVGLGFAIIIFLLLMSGVSSLWNLGGIDSSTSAVNETAVPVVKESNNVQIQLLKLAKLSSLAFTATEQEQILGYQKEFEIGAKRFDEMYSNLESLAAKDQKMKELVTSVRANYDQYQKSVNEMFSAKLEVLAARDRVQVEADKITALVDTTSSAIMEIQYYLPPENESAKKNMELVAGFTGQADTFLINVVKTLDEVRRAATLEALDGGMDLFSLPFEDGRRWYEKGAELFRAMDDQGLLEAANVAYDALGAGLQVQPSVIDHKTRELEQELVAKDKLVEADKAVSQSIDDLDHLLGSADTRFNQLQGEVGDSLSFGYKLSVIMLVVLIVLATANFNSMRMAIRRKMEDLAKLNNIGGTLAKAQSQNSALEEVLQSMHEKIGVAQGSVYLTNDNNELEVRALFPPKTVEAGAIPTKFAIGQGIIGKAAKEQKVIFVPNTEKEVDFQSKPGEVPKALLCVPLVDKDVLIGVINLSGEVKNVTFADSDYEFVSSVAQSLVTTIKNIRMREVIEEQNRNLEQKVLERTAELRQKTNDIANMMANMHQGLFTITPGGLIHKEYAQYLEQIFETDRIADRNFADLLFNSTTLGSDAVDQNITAVDAIVGEDEMMWEFNSHCLVNEMVIKLDDREKILELDWDPILNDNGEVDKLMVTVRDVTALKALEAAAEEQKRELEIIGEILAVDARKFSDFISSSEDFIKECREIISAAKDKDLDVIAKLFRNIHTVKGNARTYGLSHVTNVVHEVESTYDNLRKDEDAVWNRAELLAELTGAEEIVAKYAYVFRDKLGREGEAASGITLDPARVASWLDSIHQITSADLPSQIKGVVSEAYRMLISIDAKPVSLVISDVIESAKSLAKQLDKAEPNIVIDDGNIFIEKDAHSMLNNIFMHVFRNAMDHGIEKPEERQAKGKSPAGTIALGVTIEDGFANLKVRDDGRGLALARIYKMAVEKGMYEASAPKPSANEIANLIFASGFSTADAVTDVSGRGVGMDAVKGFLESNGGSIEVVLDAGNEDDAFRSFSTNIRLPEKFYRVVLEFARTA